MRETIERIDRLGAIPQMIKRIIFLFSQSLRFGGVFAVGGASSERLCALLSEAGFGALASFLHACLFRFRNWKPELLIVG